MILDIFCCGVSNSFAFFHFFQNVFFNEFSISLNIFFQKDNLFDLHLVLNSLSFLWHLLFSKLWSCFLCLSFPTFLNSCFSLSKCLHGIIQNANESFNSTVWERLPKSTYCGMKKLQFAVYDAIPIYNNGRKATLDIVELLNIISGYYINQMCQNMMLVSLIGLCTIFIISGLCTIFIISGLCTIFIISGLCTIFIISGLCTIFIISGLCTIFIISGLCTIFIISGLCTIFIISGLCTTFIISGLCTIFIISGLCTIFIISGLCTTFIISGLCTTFIISGLCTTLIISGLCTIFIISGLCTIFIISVTTNSISKY